MASKKTGKKKRPRNTPNGRKQPRVIFIVMFVIIMAAVGGVFLLDQSGNDTKKQPSANDDTSGQQSPDMAAPAQKNIIKLIGRWLRPDGGYIIEIANADADGSLDAAYFNPRPINVSQASLTIEEGMIKVFIELRDVGYPGATYSLVYFPQDDTLKGLYYQPSVGRSFEVVFVRK